MGQVAPIAGTLITAGAGALGKKLFGGGGGGSTSADALTTQQLRLNNQLAGTGNSLVGQGRGFLNQAGGYYSQLAGHSRSAIQAGLAPEMNAIGDVYRGASRGLDRSGLRGPTRDMAEAELSRQKAGQLSGLVSGTRARANEALANLGSDTTRQGLAAMGGAGGGYEALARGARVDRERSDAQGADLGKALGGLTADVLKNWKKGKK